ncbi:MAG TPA: quinol:cytochrome C oxidoreductase [Bacteroidia bacterium]|nr:quinol:cytochrome C oxidoreductase [Bacteroidia bacterium]
MSHININNLTYNFSQKAQKNLFYLCGAGLLLLILGLIFHHAPEAVGGQVIDEEKASLGQRVWANLLVNSYFFGGIALGATFFYALQYAAQASWSTVFMRVFSAITTFLPIGLGLLFFILICGSMGLHHLYHWQDKEAYATDPIMQHKAPYFGAIFFYGRILVFFGGWIWYQRWARKNSLAEDLLKEGTTGNNWAVNLRNAAIFLVFFGFTSSVFSWDVVMSVDTHWYSTLFGWYNFAGWWIGAIIVSNLIVMHLKSRDQMEYVNPSHVHDLGKWMFAISFLWTYLWFSQFMLIWYSNIPEEVVYYQQRWENFRGLFWITMLVNFAFPMLVLMSRDAKRNKSYLLFVALLIVFFHWTDTFLMIMPGTVGSNWGIGGIEIGMFLMFGSFFTWWILRSLSKAPILAKNHAFLEEGLHHHA